MVLMGGGMDVDNAIKWMIAKSGGGDFIVIRSTGTNAYNDYIYGLGGANSVQTLLITSTTQANDACVVQTIKNAGAVFLVGRPGQLHQLLQGPGRGHGAQLPDQHQARAGGRHQRQAWRSRASTTTRAAPTWRRCSTTRRQRPSATTSSPTAA
ncbi:hypothetical protein LP419_12080 [Massilia sp. H-1]|nr:hypothetical protein LP419_12080 [Massilia sp. H-1]